MGSSGEAILSELAISSRGDMPWLSVQLDHRFPHQAGSFHLQLAFEATAARTVVFGPSGSGKSSLLRAIAGLFQPDCGKIIVRGKTVWERTAKAERSASVPTEKRRVGMVTQGAGVFPHLTVGRNVAFALRDKKSDASIEEIGRLLQTVGAESLAGRWPRELSGGQLQRVAIARTLAARPAILLLDEPFAALDAESRQQLSENVQQWAREHSVPILTVTHNLEEAFTFGDEVLQMKEGSIVGRGKPQEVLAMDRARLLRAVGATPLN